MKRDHDLLRQLLQEFEDQKSWQIFTYPHLGMTEEELRRQHHVQLLSDAGFLTEVGDNLYRMTNGGHDFLDAIRDDTNWNRTKAVAAKAGGVGLGLMRDIALGYIRQKAVELGIPLA